MYLGYKYGTHIELYRIGRVFLGMTLAGMYGLAMGWKLTSMGIISANNVAILNLMGFFVIFTVYWITTILIVKLFIKLKLHKHKINHYIGVLVNGTLAILFVSFTSFFTTQLTFAKDGYKAYLTDKSSCYIYFDRLSRKAITKNVVKEITGDSTSQIMMSNIAK
jgi:hypothetical protein